jgi:hypothetical protein
MLTMSKTANTGREHAHPGDHLSPPDSFGGHLDTPATGQSLDLKLPDADKGEHRHGKATFGSQLIELPN